MPIIYYHSHSIESTYYSILHILEYVFAFIFHRFLSFSLNIVFKLVLTSTKVIIARHGGTCLQSQNLED
jgi:hypothetical protein